MIHYVDRISAPIEAIGGNGLTLSMESGAIVCFVVTIHRQAMESGAISCLLRCHGSSTSLTQKARQSSRTIVSRSRAARRISSACFQNKEALAFPALGGLA